MRNAYLFLFFALISSSTLITYVNYKTFEYQTPLMIENNSGVRYLKSDYFEFDKLLIPNTSATTIPINALAANLLLQEDNEAALPFLKESLNKNPYLGFTENLLAKYYLNRKMYDSAYFFSNKAIEKMPIKNHFETFISIATQDTNIKKLDSIFLLCKSLNKADNQLYDYFLSNKFNLNSINEIFKEESQIAYRKFKSLKFNYFYQAGKIGKSNLELARFKFDEGTKVFKVKEFENAIDLYKESVKLNPYEYSYLESLGGAYVANENYRKAILELKKLKSNHNPKDGKSDYLLGLAYKGLAIKDSSCYFFNISDKKMFNLAKFRIKEYCN